MQGNSEEFRATQSYTLLIRELVKMLAVDLIFPFSQHQVRSSIYLSDPVVKPIRMIFAADLTTIWCFLALDLVH